MKTRALLALAGLATALLASGCVEFDVGARSHADGDCWASQGPSGQGAGCDLGGGNGCGAQQGVNGQGAGCRFRA